VIADIPEMVELFQRVARRVGDMLRRPVVSYANATPPEPVTPLLKIIS
jgi:hypothetical protein